MSNGHNCDIEVTPHKVIMTNVKKVATEDDIRHRNGNVADFNTAAAHNNYFHEWKNKNHKFIELEFGKEDKDVKFFTGIIFAPSLVLQQSRCFNV